MTLAHGMGIGLLGSALATSTSRLVNLLLLAAYVRWSAKDWAAVVGPFTGEANRGNGVADAGGGAKTISTEAGNSPTFREHIDRNFVGKSPPSTLPPLPAPTLLGAVRSAWSTTTRGMMGRMMSLGSRGAIMVGAEASSFDMTIIFASQLGGVALDAHMCMLNITGYTS
jgi:hypothetical protein